ncbi:hypothetical protein MPC4_170003 [Methylocella tundrae]|uniref:Uncharacterized protein n=1 Tax=Methylocella tundrae TaxID=227605 RepID=A0A8B6M5W4_METTU|nr:hypothetical protein [Methylocella tundrae]VTZ24054.1 hypothetical protein MPC1_16120001 [Methylocella tundrae]VTZ49472.1 hypothetical protein MPC4_170003 [Methylocella tundrae]
MTSERLAEAEPPVIEEIEGGHVIGEGGLVHIEIGPLSLSLTGDEADEIAAAIERVRAQQRAAEGGES